MTGLKLFGFPLAVISAIGIVLLIASCTMGGVDKPDTTYSYLYKKNAQIDVDTIQSTTKNGGHISVLYISIQKGSNIVFTYKKISPDHKRSTHGEKIVKRLVFQIPPGVKKFNYQDNQLQKIQAFYRKDCSACTNGGNAVTVKHGSISGERINPVTWLITVDATVAYSGNSIHLKFREPFYEQSLLQ